MPELRRDTVTGRLVIVAADRAHRPFTVRSPPLGASPRDCPFCPGHEAMTPPELQRTGAGGPDTPGWRVRVVPNLYPIVGGSGGKPGAAADGVPADGVPADGVPATGAHEVIVLSPAHDRSLGHLDDAAAVEVLQVLRDRARFHGLAGRRFVQVMVNEGRAAGASIDHPHAQLVALDVLPPEVGAEVRRFADAGRDLVATELDDATRRGLVVLDGPAPAWCPPASAFPFAMRIAARARGARFEDAGDDSLAVVAVALRDALARLGTHLAAPPYNIVVHSAPPGAEAPSYHWFVDVLPRLTVWAGFELATGVLVNVVPPEHSAPALRDAVP